MHYSCIHIATVSVKGLIYWIMLQCCYMALQAWLRFDLPAVVHVVRRLCRSRHNC